jgi:hypothetical protein
MKRQHTLVSALVLTTAAFAALSGAAVAQNEPFDRFNSRTHYAVADSERPYQRATPAPAAAALASSGFNERTDPVGDSTRPYQQPLAAPGDEVVARRVLFNTHSDRSAPGVRDSARGYQYPVATAQR